MEVVTEVKREAGKESLEVWESQEIRMNSMCPCHSNTRKACRQCQREEVGPFFTWGCSSLNAHADFLRVSERGRRVGGGGKLVMSNFPTVLEKREESDWTNWENQKKKKALESDIMWMLSEWRSRVFFFMGIKSLAVLLKCLQKFYCDSRGDSEVVNEESLAVKFTGGFRRFPNF